MLKDFLGDGIFAVDGWKWKTQRKIASRIFTAARFKDMFDGVFKEEANQLLSVLILAARSGDALSLFFAFTLDIFGKVAFGQDINSLRDISSPKPFALAFDAVQGVVNLRFSNPFWAISERFDGSRRILDKNVSVIDDFAYSVIKEKRDRRRRRDEKEEMIRDDLLDFFMSAKNEDGSLWTDKQLRDIVLNFIIAGRDTTAQALAWTMFELSRHPEVQEKLRSEFIRVLKDDDAIPNHDTMKELKYATAVFYEILRLYPSVPVNAKTAMKDDFWPDGTFIPAHTEISFSPWVMGRMESIWGPDAKRFNPERWIHQQDGSIKKESPAKWPAFHAGPRTCLGQQLATNEAITVLSLLTRKFKFELLAGQTVTYGISLTLPMRNPLMMKVSLRE